MRLLYVSRSGVGFYHDGDEVIWLWPWRRTDWRRPWLSVSFECTFQTLRELDNLWSDYFDALRKEPTL